MQSYAAIDLHSNNGVLAIIDETDRVLKQRRISNKIEEFLKELEPFRATLQGVAVESTFNWYWLVDGLRAHRSDTARPGRISFTPKLSCVVSGAFVDREF